MLSVLDLKGGWAGWVTSYGALCVPLKGCWAVGWLDRCVMLCPIEGSLDAWMFGSLRYVVCSIKGWLDGRVTLCPIKEGLSRWIVGSLDRCVMLCVPLKDGWIIAL